MYATWAQQFSNLIVLDHHTESMGVDEGNFTANDLEALANIQVSAKLFLIVIEPAGK